ncbi:hypothetical protein B296_00033070 [Ensete ventricosum]|uniref:Uncharacterized protein n=1 Tax=Ensete ventricosum TaxID=4639 RepID=A0A426YS68_ENSVE|nr:hypothetical protein B296_00033070 [Ensete ventricosum]
MGNLRAALNARERRERRNDLVGLTVGSKPERWCRLQPTHPPRPWDSTVPYPQFSQDTTGIKRQDCQRGYVGHLHPDEAFVQDLLPDHKEEPEVHS